VAEIELEIPARSDHLALVRLVVAAAASLEPPLGDHRLDDLRLAVTEACANAIEATETGGQREGRITVRCSLLEDRIEIEVRDQGGGFDPAALHDLPEATDPQRLEHERGLGVPLMRALADEVMFEPAPDGTSVRLTIFRPSDDG
jgi:serine/threonine-protein kinase RsbW